MACTWASARRASAPAAHTAVPPVFSCVASRNKRTHRVFYCQPLPQTTDCPTLVALETYLLRFAEPPGPKACCTQQKFNISLSHSFSDRPRAPVPSGTPIGQPIPYFHLTLRADAREERQLSTRKRRVAGRPWAGVRPARLCEPHEHRLITESSPPAVRATSSGELQSAAGVAANCAALRAAKARPKSVKFSLVARAD